MAVPFTIHTIAKLALLLNAYTSAQPKNPVNETPSRVEPNRPEQYRLILIAATGL